MKIKENYMVEMTLKPIPEDVYQARGQAEMDYTKEQMDKGILKDLMVTENHKQYWLSFCVDSEQDFLDCLKGFPLYDYFDYRYHKVLDMKVQSAAGLTDPNLNRAK